MTGKDAVIRIYTAAGQLICMNRQLMNGVVTETDPSLPGVYIIKVIAGDQVFIGKLVK